MRAQLLRLTPLLAGLVLVLVTLWLSRAPLSEGTSEPAEYREGEVVSVDPTGSSMVVHVGLGWRAHDLLVEVDPARTRILFRDAALPLDQVRRGDHATLRLSPPQRVGSPSPVQAREIWLAREDGSVTR